MARKGRESARDFVERLKRRDEGKHVPRRRRHKHPRGTETSVKIDPKTGLGEIEGHAPAGQDPAWDEILRDLGYGGVLDILEVTEIRGYHIWADGEKRRMHHVKAKVRRRMSAERKHDVAELIERIHSKKAEPPKKPKKTAPHRARVLLLSDWQIGKGDGDGLEGTIDRIRSMTDQFIEILARERPRRTIIAGMGDIREGCSGWYPNQQHTTRLNNRDQRKVSRELLAELLRRAAPHTSEIICPWAPGNHGEVRDGGKFVTDMSDNEDVGLAEDVAFAFKENKKAYGHISFMFPKREDLTLTLDVFGRVMGFAHGHQAKGGGGRPQNRILRWWSDMGHGMQPLGDAVLLCTAHYHHFQMIEDGPRTWIQTPAMDGGSAWWRAKGGAPGQTGTVTLSVGAGDHVWSDLEILR